MLKVGAVQGQTRRFMRLGIVLLVMVVLSGISIGMSAAASPFTLSINEPVTLVGQTVTITGVADSPAGENSGNYVKIEWGDGDVTTLPNFTGSGPWTWGPESHEYAAIDEYTITATLYHSQEHGNDKSGATDTVGVVIPPVCETDCGGGTDDGSVDDGGSTDDDGSVDDGGSTDDGGSVDDGGSTDDGGSVDDGGTTDDGGPTDDGGSVDDGNADGSDDGVIVDDNNDTGGQGDEVLGRTIERKPLATTGSETTVLAWLGLGMLMVGATLRFGRFGSRAALATASPADELVARTLALVERTVRPGSRNWNCRG